MIEIFIDIAGYEGFYQISNFGRVRSMKRIVGKKLFSTGTQNEKIMSPGNSDGYLSITLRKNGIEEKFKVHRLVATHFIPNPENKPDVNHIEGNKSDNRALKLEWVTKSENTKHAYRIGLKVPMFGESNPVAKLTDEKVLQILAKYKTGLVSYSQLSQEYHVDKALIARIITGKSWTHVTIKKAS